jgi:hypothetical protein
MKNSLEVSQRGADLMQSLVHKSWEDSDFKNHLIKSPVSTIEKFTGKTANFNQYNRIVVEDQTDPSIIYLNIAAQPNLDELELSESQLESVAGGVSPIVTLVIIGFCGTWALDKVF